MFGIQEDRGEYYQRMKTLSIKPNCIIAIIVSYFPQEKVLRRLISSVLLQVTHVVIVDNGSPTGTQDCTANMGGNDVHWILLGHNFGVAKAQNAGIEWARTQNATHVIMLDQDSVPATCMVVNLLSVYQKLIEQGKSVAAVGPRFLDSDSGELSSFVRFGWMGLKQIECMKDNPYVEVDILLSSGLLISLSTLDEVGGMDESLFIDYVDTEWILRAKAKGYLSFGSCSAFMTHTLGENRRRLWFMRWRSLPIHKPFRFYYIFRNSVLLMRREHVNKAWRRCEFISLVRLAMMFGLFVAPRREYIRMLKLGVMHGLRGKTGNIENSLYGKG